VGDVVRSESGGASRRGAMACLVGRSGFGLAMALALFTALIWFRLRLVTDVPARAFADREENAPAPADQTDGVEPAAPADPAAPGAGWPAGSEGDWPEAR